MRTLAERKIFSCSMAGGEARLSNGEGRRDLLEHLVGPGAARPMVVMGILRTNVDRGWRRPGPGSYFKPFDVGR